MVENIRVLGDFTASEALELAGDAAAQSNGIRDIAEHEADRPESGVHLAEKLRDIRRCRKLDLFRSRGAGASAVQMMNRRGQRDELEIPAVIDEVERHAGQADAAVTDGFPFHPLESACTAVMDELRHLRDFTAAEG